MNCITIYTWLCDAAAGEFLFDILLLFITALALPLPTEVVFVESAAFGSFGGGGGGGCNRIETFCSLPIELFTSGAAVSAAESTAASVACFGLASTAIAVSAAADAFGIGMSTKHMRDAAFMSFTPFDGNVLASLALLEFSPLDSTVGSSFLSRISWRTRVRLRRSLTNSAKRLVSVILSLMSILRFGGVGGVGDRAAVRDDESARLERE